MPLGSPFAMKVVIISRSDALGGAGVASLRLCLALREQGADARLLVLNRHSGDPAVQAVGWAGGNRLRWLAERADIFARNGLRRDTLFAIDTATQGCDLTRHPLVLQADVIVLGWVNQAMLSLGGVHRLCQLQKPVVWVMHDMWNCTGVCHHSGNCQEFCAQCGSCPLLPAGSQLAHRTWQRKLKLYTHNPIHFVAVSRWLAGACRRSTLMREMNISVIPNALDTLGFSPEFVNDNPWQVDAGSKVAVMGAARLDDPIKGLDRLTDALRWLAHHRPDVAHRLHVVFYGAVRNPALIDDIDLPHTYLGYVSDLQSVYRRAHIVVSASECESFGYTLAEGMACGCVAVTTGTGGQTDIVSHLKNGYVAADLSPEALAAGIAWAVENNRDRNAQHRWVADHFDLDKVASQHLKLYEQLIREQKNKKQEPSP